MAYAQPPSPSSKGSIRGRFDFRWDVLDVIISGKSTIDSPTGFPIQSSDEANRFVLSYGYDLENPIESAELMGNYREALTFIRKNFLQPENPEGLRLEVPRKILELTDVRDLFLMGGHLLPGQANDTAGAYLRYWACAILKVMHTIAHIDKDLRTPYFSDIQQQIFDRFYKVIHRDSDGQLYLGDTGSDPMRVDLIAFETKPKKSRDSIILKLLHKPENVAEDIFDRVGIRFTTKSTFDALRVVKFLKDRMIVMPPNIKPSRSRNTLVDVDAFRDTLPTLLSRAEQGELDEASLVRELETAAHPPRVNPDNPHSSEFYRAIQFTCRQLIKLRNPLFEDIKELKAVTKSKGIKDEDLLRAVDRIDLKHIQREVRFFYPFEVQVVDQLSAEENEKGRSAHSAYKKAQVQTAQKRVMGNLVDVAR